MFYTFSELESGRLRAEARDVPDEEWATTGGGFGVVNPVAEGQDTALQEEGRCFGGHEGSWHDYTSGGRGGGGLWGARAPLLMSGQLWSQTDLDSVLFYWFTWAVSQPTPGFLHLWKGDHNNTCLGAGGWETSWTK